MSRAKTVSFSLPGTPLSPTRPNPMSPTNPQLAAPLTTTASCTTRSPTNGTREDNPQTVHPSKVRGERQAEGPSTNNDKYLQTSQRPPSRASSEMAEISQKSKPKSSVPSYVRLAYRNSSSASSARDRSPLLDHGTERIASPASVAKDLRHKSNSISHKYTRSAKYDVSQMREHLLKVEEEIKNLNRGKSTLELSVQDVRKALSINQQSISTQQKKSSRGEEVLNNYLSCTVTTAPPQPNLSPTQRQSP